MSDHTPTETAAQPDPTMHAPDAVRRDERFEPRLTGLHPGDRVELVCETTDADGDWRASATYEADADGVVDLATTAPESGSYADRPTADPDAPTVERTPADPLGLVWSLAPTDGSARAFDWTPTGSHDLQWTATPADDSEASGCDWSVDATTTVRHCDPGVTRHASGEDGHPDAWFEPAGDGPHPAVVVLHGSGGASVEATASLLASHGYAAFACRWLDREGCPFGVPLDGVADAIDWFRGHDAVDDNGYALQGCSMGSQLALHLAVRDDDVDAVVADSGGHIRYFGGGTGSWTVDGDALPVVDRRGAPPETFMAERDGARVGRELFTQMLDAADREERDAATVPFEDASADLLWLSGSDDIHWPAAMFGNMLVARLDATGYEHDYEHRVYHDAGHSIGVANDPQTFRPAPDGIPVDFGGTPEDAASAAADAWPRVLDHLDDALDG